MMKSLLPNSPVLHNHHAVKRAKSTSPIRTAEELPNSQQWIMFSPSLQAPSASLPMHSASRDARAATLKVMALPWRMAIHLSISTVVHQIRKDLACRLHEDCKQLKQNLIKEPYDVEWGRGCREVGVWRYQCQIRPASERYEVDVFDKKQGKLDQRKEFWPRFYRYSDKVSFCLTFFLKAARKNSAR